MCAYPNAYHSACNSHDIGMRRALHGHFDYVNCNVS